MRKKILAFVPLLSFAMGGQPTPNKIVSAKLIDKSGKEHFVKAFVCDDRTFFNFKDGDITVKVPFDKIEKVVVVGEGENLTVKVYFKNGKVKTFVADSNTECTGVSDFGTVEASLDKLKEIDFLKVQ